MSEPVFVNKANPLRPAEDFYFLRRQGIEHIEKLSGSIWTDFNVHETGIALLESLCYACTDLAYRTGAGMSDLVAPQVLQRDSWKNIFYTARQVLPGNPVTINDIRKLLIDIPGVRNAWIRLSEDVEVPMRVNLPRFSEFEDLLKQQKEKGIAPCGDASRLKLPLSAYLVPGKKIPWDLPSTLEKDEVFGLNYNKGRIVELNGLYKIIIEYEQDVIDDGAKKKIRRKVWERLHRHRSLCEDFLTVSGAQYRDFKLQSEILLKDDADPELTLARLCFEIQNYFTPSVRFYSLEELWEMGVPSEEIFEGPFLDHGFIRDEELDRTDFFRDMRLSDIMNTASDIDGIVALRRFKVNDNLVGNKPGAQDTDDHCSNERFFDEWISGMKKAKLVGRLNVNDVEEHVNDDDTKDTDRPAPLRILKGNVRVNINVDRFRKLLKDLRARERDHKLKGQSTDFAVPPGEYQNHGEFYPVQYMLPKAYRVGEDGLPLRDGNARLVQALQLKGYLAVFEQLFLNYAAQLTNINKLFSFDDIDVTNFVGMIVEKDADGAIRENIKGYLHLFADAERYINEIQAITESDLAFEHRRGNMLNHLMARFSESMDEYTALERYRDPKAYARRARKAKSRLLSDYPAISGGRGKGYNYKLKQECEDCPESEKDEDLISRNVSGVERRVSRLLGFDDYRRKTLAPENLRLERDADDPKRGRAVLYDDDHGVLLETESIETKCEDEIMHGFIEAGCCADNFVKYPESREHTRRTRQTAGGFGFALLGADRKPIATSPAYKDAKTRDAALKRAMEILRRICHTEGMHLVEHILLRPRGDAMENVNKTRDKVVHALLDICADKCDRWIIRNHRTPILYDFDITILTGKDCIDDKRWQVTLRRIRRAPAAPVVIFRGTFTEYEEASEFISTLRAYGSEFVNFRVFKNVDDEDSYFFRLADEQGNVLAESLTCYKKHGTHPLTKKKSGSDGEKEFPCRKGAELPDAWDEIKDLREYLSMERDLYCCEDPCDHNTDPYSFRLSVVLPCWSKRFRDTAFRRFTERTLSAEMPAHIHASIYWLSPEQMRAFETAFFEWRVEIACNDVPRIDIVNDLVREVNALQNCDQPCRHNDE